MNIKLQSDEAFLARMKHLELVDMLDDVQKIHAALLLAINGTTTFSHHEKTALAALAGQVTVDLGLLADRLDDTHPANDDAEMIAALRREFLDAWAVERAPGDPDDEEIDAAYNTTNEIVCRIERLDSTSPDAIILKALAIKWIYSGEEKIELVGPTDCRLASQIVDAIAKHEMKSVI